MFNKKKFIIAFFIHYSFSILIFLSLSYLFQYSEIKKFELLTKVDYHICDSILNDDLKNKCLKIESRVESANKTKTYQSYKNSNALNQYFFLLGKDDYKEVSRLSINYQVQNLADYDNRKKILEDLIPDINDIIDDSWHHMYIIINPLTSLSFMIFISIISFLFFKFFNFIRFLF